MPSRNTENSTLNNKTVINISLGESNTVVSANTMYKHLQCSALLSPIDMIDFKQILPFSLKMSPFFRSGEL